VALWLRTDKSAVTSASLSEAWAAAGWPGRASSIVECSMKISRLTVPAASPQNASRMPLMVKSDPHRPDMTY
jgi:hypothetical protein